MPLLWGRVGLLHLHSPSYLPGCFIFCVWFCPSLASVCKCIYKIRISLILDNALHVRLEDVVHPHLSQTSENPGGDG